MQLRTSSAFRRGMSAIEILLVVCIVVILSVIMYKSWTGLKGRQSLESNMSVVLSVVERARSLTVSSKNGSQYSVHFASGAVTIFTGSVYSAGAGTNEVTALSSAVSISSINLTGGAVDLVYDKITGKTSRSGTVILSLVSDGTQTKTLTFYTTGFAETN